MPSGKSPEEMNRIGAATRFKAGREQAETARRGGIASGLARAGKKTLTKAILDALTDEDIEEIAQGAIQRAKKSTMAFTALRDTVGEKPADVIEAIAELTTLTAEERAEERRRYAEEIRKTWND